MWNTPSKRRLNKLPRLYETEHVPLKDKLIYLHFFIGNSDFFICEYDGADLFWGFVILNNDLQNSEWGFSSLAELRNVTVGGWLEIDCELEEHWKVSPALEIEKIREAHGWEVENEHKSQTSP